MAVERLPPVDEDQAALRLAAGGNAALCTIVGIDGSFSRRLGSQLAVAWNGEKAGSLADGCLESELANQARAARLIGGARIHRYGRGSPYIDFRLPCGSGLDILVDPVPDVCLLRQVVRELDGRKCAAIHFPAVPAPLLETRLYMPQLRLVVFGEGPELAEFNRLAGALGIELVEGPKDGAGSSVLRHIMLDQWTGIVLLFHDHDREREILRWALETPAFYIGAMGGEVARSTRQQFLAQAGVDAQVAAKIRSPAGLIPRARDARVLALSIMAEVVSEYEGVRA